MANGPALSTARSGEIYAGSEIIDSFSQLDVLYANQFEGSSFHPEHINQTEENFYRGAPPEWLNFHISEQAEADGTGTPFVKRDGYDRLVKEICQRRKLPRISTVSLFHQSGCGGTTLAMKVLWDLRKTFRSAVLRGPTPNVANVAEEVVHLFTAGSRGHQNTVLLLVNDEQILESLQENIMMKIAEQKIATRMPVVILLNCIRRDEFLQRDQVFLQEKLSYTEKQNFNEKKEELRRKFGDKCNQFHGFNIMQNNFSYVYVKQTCKVFSTVRRSNRPKKTQLAAFLSLLNAYVPGSYLLESQCLDFFQHGDYIHGDFSLKDRMEPFSHLIITFKQDGSEKKVRMAHSLIARCCVELMAEAGVTRSDTARNLLTTLCKEDTDPFLAGFVKDLLTKRRLKPKQMETEENPTNSSALKEEPERFSRLILDIQKMENDVQSASVLKMAAKKFYQNPFFPQALSRFYYIELKDYNQAEIWAERAKQRDPLNSFVADTLGQVHKNHLKNIEYPTTPRKVLQLATKAIEAFKDEERLAENELETDMKGDGTTKAPNLFNTRGLCGYLQVCNLVYGLLVSQNETWREVLTQNVSLGSVLEVLGDNKLLRFNGLINSLRDEVERKCAFFDKYLTYSKPDVKKDDPPYITKDTSECFRKYVGDSPPKHFKQKGADLIQKLKQNLADTSAEVLSCLKRDCTEADLKEITTWWEELFLCTESVTALANYIFAFILSGNMRAKFPSKCRHLAVFDQKMPLISENSPELHMLTLLLCWPTDSKEKCVLDLGKLIPRMHCAYEHAYKIRFRSRYLRPLFFIGKGQELNRIVHRRVLEGLLLEQNNETTQDWSNNWSNEMIFQNPKVQEGLLKFEGAVRNYRVYANIDGALIELDANLRNSLWRPRQVFFYLGFTIRGPVAFAIQTKPAENVQIPEMASSEPKQIKPELSALEDTTGGQHFVDRHRTDLIKRVSDTGAILDRLKDRGFISNKNQEAVRALKTTQEQMELILQCLTSASMRGKDALYEILKRMRSMRAIINELEESEKGNKRYYIAAEMASACSAISLSKKKTNVERVTHSTTITSEKSKRSAQRSSKDSNDWTRLDPVIDTVDEVQTYSLQSDAGRFECGVSALRWVCKEKVSFKYQFCSWEEHSERSSCIGYMPAGPLLDITVIAGRFEEVHLPHWICVDHSSKMSDMFVVLHIDTCGDFLEQVFEVTSSHVKLLQPVFSPRLVMIRKRFGLPVKVFYNVWIYMKIQSALTLHIYLVPPDPALQKEVEKQHYSRGYLKMLKPGPDKPMLLGSNFSLTTDKADAKIQPSTRELRYDSTNQFEVFIRNADDDFTLKLESEKNTTWTCSIYKEDYQSQSADHEQDLKKRFLSLSAENSAPGQHFVDRHRTALINRVTETDAVLDKLVDRKLISNERYNAVRALTTTQDQMRDILRCVTAAGTKGKDALYEILKRMKSMRPLITELEGSQ